MLNMIKGCRIHDPSVLNEGYEITDYGFVANVDADKIQALFESFVKLHNDMCFLVFALLHFKRARETEESFVERFLSDDKADSGLYRLYHNHQYFNR